jgi:hypothetical protein
MEHKVIQYFRAVNGDRSLLMQWHKKFTTALGQVTGENEEISQRLIRWIDVGNELEKVVTAVRWGVRSCAAPVINKGRKDDEGFTAYRRWKGKEFTRPVAEFGECVMYWPAASVGKNKSNVRWMDGVWPGMKPENGESIVGTADGVIKARDFRSKPEDGGPWSNDEIDLFNGVPWEPDPRSGGGFEINPIAG